MEIHLLHRLSFNGLSDLLSTNHKAPADYLGRVNDKEFPKHIAAN